MMQTTEELLATRKQTHGDYTVQSKIVDDVLCALGEGPNWKSLSPAYKVAIYLIALKLGRIVTGNPDEPDHWADIAGYAKLAEKETPNASGLVSP